jgi:type IV secretion system protein VirB4
MVKMKKIKKSLKDNVNASVEVGASDFIPYACHYDPYSLLTKNGELLQVLKITGFAFETVKDNNETPITVRQAIREALENAIPNASYSVYLHTIRKKTNLSTEGEHPPGFTKDLDHIWSETNDWTEKYTNELYLTIMTEGKGLDLWNINTFIRSIYYPSEINFRKESLKQTVRELNAVVKKVHQKLDDFGARRLACPKIEGTYFSEPLSFLSEIMNLTKEHVPLNATNASEALPTHKTSFGYNTLSVTGPSGTHHGAILTVKNYHEVSARDVDDFLQVEESFIVTESFDFVSSKDVAQTFKKQMEINELSGDKYLSRVSGLEDIIAADTGSPLDYGEHQITINIVNDSKSGLQDGVSRVYDALSGLGLITVREDIFIENCYWAQLPGNFQFNKRMSPVNFNHIGGFASLYSFPAGRRHNNLWGSAVSVFYTANNTPYFFNFHYENNGHTFIVGPYGSGKTVLLNFLVAQAMKYQTNLFFFDHKRGGEIFIRAIGGNYERISENPSYGQAGFNPLTLPENAQNKDFLRKWFSYLIGRPLHGLSQEDKKLVEDAVSYNYHTLIPQDRKLANVLSHIWPVEDGADTLDNIKQKLLDKLMRDAALNDTGTDFSQDKIDTMVETKYILTQWYGDGKYSYLFDNIVDELAFDSPVYGADLTDLVEEGTPLIPTIFYIMHRIEQSLSGKPTIIVLDEAWSLIDNYAFNDHIEQWLEDLRSKNALVIFATESVDGAEKSPITKVLAKEIETKIFFPNPDATPFGYEEVFGLSKTEYKLLNSMNPEVREFLLIHNVDAVICKLDLSHMEKELSVLSSSPEALGVMETSIIDGKANNTDWLPLFHKRMEQ